MKRVRVWLLGPVVLLALGLPVGPVASARESWSELGDIQVLEGPEKIWVFVEVVRITDYTDELVQHLMSRHPDRQIVSRSVFTIDRAGNVSKTPLAELTGPDFDPDQNPIFRFSDEFYQYRSGSLGRPASFYRWHRDRFIPLDGRDSDAIKKQLGADEPADLVEVMLRLEAMTEQDGWRNAYSHAMGVLLKQEPHAGQERLPGWPDVPFVSDRHQVQVVVRMADQLKGVASFRRSSVVASSLSKTRPWTRTLINVNAANERARTRSIRRPRPADKVDDGRNQPRVGPVPRG